MQRIYLSLIIHTSNNEEELQHFVENTHTLFTNHHIPYEIIVMNPSSKITKAITSLSSKFSIQEYEHKQHRAFTEVVALAKGNVLVEISSCDVCSPEVLLQMTRKIQNSTDVVITSCVGKKEKFYAFWSKTLEILFGKPSFAYSYNETIDALMVKKSTYTSVLSVLKKDTPSQGELLQSAQLLGFAFETLPSDHQTLHRVSRVEKIRSMWQQAMRIGLLTIEPQQFKSQKTKMRDAGVRFNKQKYVTHTTLHHKESAIQTVSPTQKATFEIIFLMFVAGLISQPLLVIQATIATLSFIYFVDVLFSVYLLLRSLRKTYEISATPKQLRNIPADSLPVYSILCPLYKEAHMLPHFLKSIAALDYPKDKLDVMLLLEEDDAESLGQVNRMKIPSYVRVIVIPYSQPKTKPKACNYGLSFAKGKYIVIYDAEDIPDPLQLKKAVLGFSKVGKNVACLQAKLSYYNSQQNLLTRFFTAEYALWFDITLTGLQSISTTIPLGGTSNHFRTKDLRELAGWDPFNVTEDADLGIRLFKKGYQTAVIDSVTLEEANSDLSNWLRQRSRWIKGYMQTYLVHTRELLAMYKNLKLHALIFQLVIGGKIAFIFINPILWIITAAYFLLHPWVGPAVESVYPPIVLYMAIISLLFGNFLFLFSYMIAVAKRQDWELVKYTFFVPIYWLFMSWGGVIALYQLLVKPHYWEKTIHGLHLSAAYFEQFTPELITASAPMAHAAAYIENKVPLFQRKTIISNTKDFFGLFAKKSLYAHPERSDRQRILIFNWRDTKHMWAGGAETYIFELAKRWVKKGHEVTIFCGNDGLNQRNSNVEGVQIIRRGGFYTVYFWALLYYIFKFQGVFDVVIDSENGIPFFTPLYVREPVFLLIHHVHQEVFREHLPKALSLFAEFLESKLMPFIYKRNTIITVSESSRKEITTLGFANDLIEVIKPGVDRDFFSFQPKTSYPSFLYLGRLKDYKNIHVAIKAFAKLITEFPHAKFTIAGSGESLGRLRSLTRLLHIDSHVAFLGRVSEEQKKLLLGQSWVLVQPSMIEGWGMTVIEANASGTPVIASNVCGLRDSIVHGKTGLLVKVKDVEEFTHAMRQCVADKYLRTTLSKQAYAWSSQFSWDTSAKAFSQTIWRTYQRARLAFEQEFSLRRGISV